MANLIRTIDDPCPTLARRRRAGRRGATARVDHHQRPGRLRLGHGLRHADPSVSRAPDRRAARPLGRTIMLNQLLERLVHADGRSVALGVEALAGRPARAAECRIAEFRLEAGLPVWRFEAGGRRAGEAPADPAPPEHGLCLLPARRRRRAGRPAPAPAAGALPPARRAGGLAPSRPVPVHRLGRPLRDLRRRADPAACG